MRSAQFVILRRLPSRPGWIRGEAPNSSTFFIFGKQISRPTATNGSLQQLAAHTGGISPHVSDYFGYNFVKRAQEQHHTTAEQTLAMYYVTSAQFSGADVRSWRRSPGARSGKIRVCICLL